MLTPMTTPKTMATPTTMTTAMTMRFIMDVITAIIRILTMSCNLFYQKVPPDT
jgi:hypothetical protein